MRPVRLALAGLIACVALVGCADTGETAGSGYVAGDGSIVVLDQAERGRMASRQKKANLNA